MENLNTEQFNYLGVPFVIQYGKGLMPTMIVPDQIGLMRKFFIVDLIINFNGNMILSLNSQLLDPLGNEIAEAANKPTAKQQTIEDFNYFYELDINGQMLGESISKQLVNGILENSPFAINCFSWTGEFLQPISLSHTFENDLVTVIPVDVDAAIPLEYSIDGGLNWQDENTFLLTEDGEYQIDARYKGKELRKGKSFKAVMPVEVIRDTAIDEDTLI